MKAIKYRIKAINPLIISSKRGDSNMVGTKSYIPGNNILGVLASLYIKKRHLKNAHKDKSFRNLFLNHNTIFTNAYISDDANRYFPCPFSIKVEKYPGNNKSLAYDLLFGNNQFDKPTKSNSDFVSIDEKRLLRKMVRRSISFHHAIKKDASINNEIFNYESIMEKQIFEGNIIGNDQYIDELKQIFDERKTTVYIGLSKNSQYGKAEIELINTTDYISEIPTDIESDDTDIVMTLLSDTIVFNEYGLSTTDIDNLESLLKVKVKNSFIRMNRNEQFVGVWGLKNQSEAVFAAGSCFLLDKLPENYEKLQLFGIGEKTNEGFGRVVFGWQNGNFEYLRTSKDIVQKKPKGDPPKIVSNIVLGIIKKRLTDKAISKAIEDAYSFKYYPLTKSLCGKLQSISSDINEFKDNLQKITKNEPAKNQLKRCNNKKLTLLDYLRSENFLDISSLLHSIKNLDKFTQILENDSNLNNDLKRIYLKSFFNFMRKYKRSSENE